MHVSCLVRRRVRLGVCVSQLGFFVALQAQTLLDLIYVYEHKFEHLLICIYVSMCFRHLFSSTTLNPHSQHGHGRIGGQKARWASLTDLSGAYHFALANS